jgi:carboxymethylenebutenolidase
MKPLEVTMNLFQKYLAEEFAEDYAEGRISRREALKLILSVTGSVLVANTILAGCTPPPEPALTAQSLAADPTLTDTTRPEPSPDTPTATAGETPVQPTQTTAAPTPGVTGNDIEIPISGATLLAYLAQPAGNEPRPVVLVCHENRGLTEHIKDVTRRVAQSGYVGLAVDLLSRQGGSAAVGSDAVPGALGNIAVDQIVEDFVSGWRYLQDKPFARTELVGMVGFCFGGGVTWQVATKMPELKAAVPFYGPSPDVEDVSGIQAAVLAIYAGNDTRINQGIPAIEAAMSENNKVYKKIIYPDVDHAFHNDTGSRYNPQAAQDAWSQTLAWFGTYLV